jgi:hypothetical protein
MLGRAAITLASLLAAGLLLARPSPAGAWVLAEDELEERSTELGLLIRTFAFVLEPLPGLDTKGIKDLGLIDETQGLGILDLRLSFSHKTPRLQLVLHNQLTLTARSMAPTAGSLVMGRGMEPPRWFPLQADIVDDDGITLRESVDWVYAAVTWGRAVITVGRQPITFGRGKLFKPMDLIATFALTEVDTEYKPGADALRVDLSLFEQTFLTLVAAAGEHGDELSLRGSSFALRARQGWSKGELGLLGGYLRRDGVIGADAVFDLGSFDIYTEATLTIVSDESLSPRRPETERAVVRGLVGATFKPLSKLTVTPEIFFNGFGRWDPAEYLQVAISERAAIGETFNLGMLYLAGVAQWEAHPLLNLTAGAILNPRDPSGLLTLGASLSAADNIQLQAGAYLPLGETPELSPPDPLLGIPPIPRPRSEFGLYPIFFFVELKMAM